MAFKSTVYKEEKIRIARYAKALSHQAGIAIAKNWKNARRLFNDFREQSNIFDSCLLKIEGISYPLPKEVPGLLQKGAMIVDLREELETEIKAFGVDQIVFLPHSEFEEKWMALPLDKPLILADAVGIWSKKYAVLLISKGYKNIASLAGGIADWEKDGFPMKAGKYEPLNGVCACMIKPKERKYFKQIANN